MTAVGDSLLVLAACAACREPRVRADAGTPATRPARPAGCREVAPSEPLQAVVDDPAVTAICLAAGTYAGPIAIRRAVTLWGPPQAIVRAARPGSTIEITGTGGAVLGLTVDGTGGRFDATDAAVRVTGRDIRVEGVTVIEAVFGILVDSGERVRVVGNHVHGGRDPAVGLRGDTIRLWQTKDSVVADNVVEDGRDLVVWYSRGNHVTGNEVRRGRYGLHFMYSHDNEVAHNRLLDGTVGIFVMYSRGLDIHDNLIAGAGGAAGMAIGLKESGNIRVRANQLVRNTTGIYVDASPLQLGDHLDIERNELRLDDRGIVFHSSGHRVAIRDNDFADNQTQVQVDGGGDALDVAWSGNYFDDYEGYDLDGDGRGDVPYEARSLSGELTSSHPGLALFRGTPALALVDAAAHLDPLFQPTAVLSDASPRMTAHASAVRAEVAP
jgi:nitrous oxidase accessory protein